MSIGKEIKRTRIEAGDSQLKLSMDANVSRESISAYETDRAETPSDIYQHAMGRYDNPLLAVEAATNYYGSTFLPYLNGKNADLHRASVTMKNEEELEEAIEALKKIKPLLSKCPSAVSEFEKQDLMNAAEEVAESMTAGFHFLISLKEYGISWNDVWAAHKKELISKGYVSN